MSKIEKPKSSGFCIWLTGLSGAGKTTIAKTLEAQLESYGRTVTLLDGDLVRKNLSYGLGFSREDRDRNILRIAFVAGEIVRHGGAVICAAISPYESTRQQARAAIPLGHMALCWIDTPLEVCEARDVKGLYAKARSGEIKHFTGIDDPYEVPENPDLVLSTVDCTPQQDVDLIIRYLRERSLLEAYGD